MASPSILPSFEFNAMYVQSLRQGNPSTEEHFVSHFTPILRRKLRARVRSADIARDLLQETFLRVLTTLRSGHGVRNPERFEIFVIGVCNNVLRETYRRQKALMQFQPDSELAGKEPSPYACALAEETRNHVRQVLSMLEPEVRAILQVVFLEEQGRDEICRRFGINRNYLRLLIYRAKNEFSATQNRVKGKTRMHMRRSRRYDRRVLPALRLAPTAPRTEALPQQPILLPSLLATDLPASNCWL
ncbi:MAG: RNA polymerase sigma factor [Candidatus Angelobacter sp.]